MSTDERILNLATEMYELKQEELEERIEILYGKLSEVDEDTPEHDELLDQIQSLEDETDFYDLDYFVTLIESERDEVIESEKDF